VNSCMKANILVIGPTPPPYHGVSVVTELIVKSLKNADTRFSVIHLDTADRRGPSNIGKLDLWNVLLALYHGFYFLCLLAVKRPDVVYIPISQATLPFLRDCLFLIPARLLRKRVVVHLHGSYFREFYRSTSGLMRWVIRYALERTRRVIVLGKTLADLFKGIVPRDRLRVIPNGIEDYLKYCEYKGLKGNSYKILYLSTLSREKGVLDVLQAIPLVIAKVQNVKFIFVGEWFRDKDREEAMTLIKKLSIDPYVEFKGPIGPPHKYSFFQEADIFILPSYYDYEGQPLVILEAMCAGLPIITTNAGCIAETVVDGVNGFIVPKRDPKAIGQKILFLLEDSNLRKQIAQANREKFLKYYSSERFIEDLVKVFEEVIQE